MAFGKMVFGKKVIAPLFYLAVLKVENGGIRREGLNSGKTQVIMLLQKLVVDLS